MDINKIIKKIRDLREEMAAGGVPTNNASILSYVNKSV